MPPLITINILIPQIGIRIVKVRQSDPIAVLRSYVHRPHVDFVYDGQILNSECSFQSCQIGNDDSVVAVDPGHEKATYRWMKLTEELDDFSNSVQCAINPKCRGEFLRLRDIHRIKLESRPRTFRRMTKMLEKDVLSPIAGDTVVAEPPSEISCEPLPMMFRGD